VWLVKPGIVVVVLWYLTRNTSAAAAAAPSSGKSPQQILCELRAALGSAVKWIADPTGKFQASAGAGGYCSGGGDVQFTDPPADSNLITQPSQVDGAPLDGPVTSPSQVYS